METHLILVGLLSICSLSSGQDCNQQLLENTDFPGTDITSVYSPDVEHCQLLCTQHASCLFFTFIRADWTRDSRHFYCYLKTTPSGQPNVRTALLGVTSGFSLKSCNSDLQPCLSKVYQDVDFYGEDYRTLFTADYEGCQRECTQDPACQFFTYVNGVFTPERIRYKCHLKFSWPVLKIPTVEKKTGVISGFSHNLQMAQHSDIGTQTACQGKFFPSIDIPGGDFMTLPAASPEHCQTLCSAHPSCTFFSFVSNNFNCHLKGNKDEMVTTAKVGVTSGLPAHFCQLNNSWVKFAHKGVDFRGSYIRFELMDSADMCQRSCTDDPNCQYYAYVTENFSDRNYRRRCYINRAITMPAPPRVNKLANVVSGFHQRNCV